MKKLKKIPLILTILSIVTFISPVNADVKVVTSIKPLHSLASYLMDGVGKPDLIVDGFASPHGFSMKPSHAKMLQNADLVFWVGEDLESFLEKPLSSIAKKAEKIELMETKGLQVLKFRERNIFDEHDDHDDHDGHAKKKKDGHDDHDDHDGHAKKIMMDMLKRKKMDMMTTTIMMDMLKRKKMDMMTTTIMMDMTIMKDMRMVNLIHTFG